MYVCHWPICITKNNVLNVTYLMPPLETVSTAAHKLEATPNKWTMSGNLCGDTHEIWKNETTKLGFTCLAILSRHLQYVSEHPSRYPLFLNRFSGSPELSHAEPAQFRERGSVDVEEVTFVSPFLLEIARTRDLRAQKREKHICVDWNCRTALGQSKA
jgi:hypothetical protein